MTAPTTAVVKQDPIRAQLEARATSYAALLPADYSASRLITGVMTAVLANPKLRECTPQSMELAVRRVAQWGLDIGMTAHLVPYKGKVTAIPDYKGLIQLMCDAGARKVEAYVVYEGEQFDWELGTNAFIKHRPKADHSKPIVAAYAIVTLAASVVQFEVMTVDEIEAIRKKSQSWAEGKLTAWYARKCPIRRLAKYVRQSTRLQAALELDPEIAPEGEGRPANVSEDGEILDAEFHVEPGDAQEPDA